MGFFQKVKEKLGIGGVKLELEIPGQASKSEGEIKGKVILTTKREEEVIHLEVELRETHTKGKGEHKRIKNYTLGKVKVDAGFTIKPGESKEIEFNLPFKAAIDNNDALQKMGGALGMLGKAGSMLSDESFDYRVHAMVDVKSAALDPNRIQEIRLVA